MKVQSYLIVLLALLLFSGCGSTTNAAFSENNEGVDTSTSNNTDGTDAGESVDNVTEDTVVDPTISGSCSPLPGSTGSTVMVSPSESSQLKSIVASATEGTTILLQDGIYNLNGDALWFNTSNVALRSNSGNPEAVVLNGDYTTTEVITIAASNITIAELTIQKAFTHPVHVVSSDQGDTLNTRLYRLHVIDPRAQAIKINPHKAGFSVDNGEISCSKITLTDAGRPLVNPIISGCYTGGIDAHGARDWIVRDNYFTGFWCETGLSEHAIHFWNGSRGTVVERNVLVDNTRGIGFGLRENYDAARVYNDLVCPESAGIFIGHYEGIIRNNFISVATPGVFNSEYGFDCGIYVFSSCKTEVLHNTIMSSGSNFASIDVRFAGTNNSKIYNNLMSHNIIIRNGAIDNDIRSNLENASIDFVLDINNADLHLSIPNASQAIDSGLSLDTGMADTDIDGLVRDASPDIGADEI